jgi:hypothetical protein
MKRKHLVRLSSDDVSAEHVFWLTPSQLNFVLEMAQAFNSKAKFSVDIRMEVDPTDPTDSTEDRGAA